jgi:hypothetical protein
MPASGSRAPRPCRRARRGHLQARSRSGRARCGASPRWRAASRTSRRSGVAVEEHAELVDAVDDLVLVEDVVLSCTVPACRTSRAATAPRRCRGGRRSGRSAGTRASALAHGVVIGDRDRLVVGDEEAVLRAGRRAPGAHAGVGAGLEQVDRRRRQPSCVPRSRASRSRACPSRARPAACPPTRSPRPTRCSRRRPWASERGALGVALGDVDALDADALHERAQSSRSSAPCVEPMSRATSRSACLTNHDTMPGLAPQHDTAVDPPGLRRRHREVIPRRA